ncbi:hypothetical protein V1477_002497 [Vespula maculifrons]|uniref:Uncharacterized protein n=1 Tax=Vespula maculifrons TaxID=7453 RepID=A0ABD2CWU0_VESMC
MEEVFNIPITVKHRFDFSIAARQISDFTAEGSAGTVLINKERRASCTLRSSCLLRMMKSMFVEWTTPKCQVEAFISNSIQTKESQRAQDGSPLNPEEARKT